MTRTIYRDTKTGRFASKQTWKRSKARGGTRYKRSRIKKKEPDRGPVLPPPPEEPEVFEFVVSFSYDASGRSFDVIVTATSDAEAQRVAKEFLKSDPNGRKIVKAGFTGWRQRVARGNASDQEAGEAEYREDSEEE